MSILQLLIISLIALIAQSHAELEDDITCQKKDIFDKAKNYSELQNKTLHLYYAVKSLHNMAGASSQTLLKNMVKIKELFIHNGSKKLLNDSRNHFTSQCKVFTTALSVKHQLQDWLFHQTNMIRISQYIKPLYSILVYLQMMINILDDIEFIKSSSRCVRLTADQYKMMYWVIDSEPLLLKMLPVETGNWIAAGDIYEWKMGPPLYDCAVLHESL